MDIEEFRKSGEKILSWMVDYLENPEKYPVLSRIKPGEIKKKLPASPPLSAEKLEDIFKDFENIILPGITHWNHPNFFAYFATTGSAPGILGEMLSATLNVNAMLWRTSPSATELEEVVLDWLRQMIGLPDIFKGVITDTASVSSLVALTAARENLNKKIREDGLAGRADVAPLKLYCSEQAHSSIEKAAIVLGIGQNGVRKIKTDNDFRMDVKALISSIEHDIKNNNLPFAVVATAGTTSTTSFDPVEEIAELCSKEGLWLHVDAAYGGMAGIIPEKRSLLKGCEYADSFVTNPHKWLFTPLDCSALYTRHPEILRRAFSIVPEYLSTAEENVTNYMDWGIQLGRRFRALKLWFIIRAFGVEEIRKILRQQCEHAEKLVSLISKEKDFEIMAPTVLGVICFRYHPERISDENKLSKINKTILENVNSTGKVFLSHTKLNEKYTIRFAIGNISTKEEHIMEAWKIIVQKAKEIDWATM